MIGAPYYMSQLADKLPTSSPMGRAIKKTGRKMDEAWKRLSQKA